MAQFFLMPRPLFIIHKFIHNYFFVLMDSKTILVYLDAKLHKSQLTKLVKLVF